MRIGPVRTERRNGRPTVAARIEWEETDRPAVDLFFTFDTGNASPSERPDPFLIGVYVPAIRAGERRIAVEGEVCPRLRDGLSGAAAILRHWYGEERRAPVVEASNGFRAGFPSGDEGLLLSGGLDSLFLLDSNRSRFPRGHPASFRRAVHLSHFARELDAETAARLGAAARRATEGIAAAADLELTVVSTNVLDLHGDFPFFATRSHGSFLGAAAQLFAGELRAVSVAASDDITHGLGPWGSHPLLDPLYGTASLAFLHDGIGFSRQEKAAFVAGSDIARRHLFVCPQPAADRPLANCGRCEKCLRTMIELLVAGAFEGFELFPKDVDPAAILAIPDVPTFRVLSYYWAPLIPLLRRARRADLADAIVLRLEEVRRSRAWHGDRGWKGRMRRLDRALFGGRLAAPRRPGTRHASGLP